MAGSPLTAYLDLQNRTGSAIFKGKKEIVNDAQKKNFGVGRFIKGKGERELLQGGKNITDEWFGEDPLVAQTHLPGHNFTWPNPQTSKYWTAGWRYLTGSYSFLDQEIEFNAPESMTARGRFQQIKAMHYGKRQASMTSLWNKIDNLAYAEPNFDTMETNTTTASTEPYSLACFNNEQTNGLFNPTGSGAGTAWTTVEGLSPTATGNGEWKNQRSSYTSASTTAAGGVIDAFDSIFLDLNYEAPPTMKEYFEMPETQRIFIETSKKGMQHYMACIRDRQDIFPLANKQDAGVPMPVFRGIPVYYSRGLDLATWYPNHLTPASATDNVTEGQATTNGAVGPRYYFWHPKYIRPVFHARRYFVEKWELKPTDQYEMTTIPISVWYNFIADSRARHGVVYPGAAAIFSAY